MKIKSAFLSIAAIHLLAGIASAQRNPQDVLRDAFQDKAKEIAERVDGVVGLTVKDLTTGDTFAVNGDMVFTQASAIKLPILFELFRRVELGDFSLVEPVTLQESDMTVGSGVLQQLTPGNVTMSLRDVATLMVTVSDNTATNMIIDRVGMESVNRTMAGLGLTHTKLQRKMMDSEAWLNNRENLSTPNEQAQLLERIYKGEDLRKESNEEILRILSIPKPSQIRPLLPPDTRVAHKTGSVPGVVVDVGIVYLPERPFIVSAMTNWINDPEEAAGAISQISLAAYRYFDRLANSNRYGHKK